MCGTSMAGSGLISEKWTFGEACESRRRRAHARDRLEGRASPPLMEPQKGLRQSIDDTTSASRVHGDSNESNACSRRDCATRSTQLLGACAGGLDARLGAGPRRFIEVGNGKCCAVVGGRSIRCASVGADDPKLHGRHRGARMCRSAAGRVTRTQTQAHRGGVHSDLAGQSS